MPIAVRFHLFLFFYFFYSFWNVKKGDESLKNILKNYDNTLKEIKNFFNLLHVFKSSSLFQ